ncbi:MAG: hypothetical protein OHK0038_16570 [Flammeovirgaceae bacterium]
MNNFLKIYTTLLVLILLFFSCKTNKTKNSEKLDKQHLEQDIKLKITAIAQKHWNTNDKIDISLNQSKDYAFCKQKISKVNPTFLLRVLVIEISSGTVVYENTLQNGSGSWDGDYWLRLSQKPEIVRKDEKNHFWYHVKQRKKYESKTTDY